MTQLKPNQQRAKIAIVLIWIVLGSVMVSTISDYLQYLILQKAARNGGVSLAIATANDTRQRIVGIVYIIVSAISAFTFILWFRRAYYNLHTKSEYHLSYSEGWAAGSWFVPVLNYIRPYYIMKELYEETQRLLTKGIEHYVPKLKPYFVGLWWGIWILSKTIGGYVFKYSWDAETIPDLTNSTIISMLSSILEIPLVLITIKVIKDYSSVEPLLYELKDDNIK